MPRQHLQSPLQPVQPREEKSSIAIRRARREERAIQVRFLGVQVFVPLDGAFDVREECGEER